MKGYNNSGIPSVDLEAAGLVVFTDHAKFIQNVMVGAAKVSDKFITSTYGGVNTILNRGGAAETLNLVRFIMSTPSHPDYQLLHELVKYGYKTIYEYIKYRYRTLYLGSSYSIQGHETGAYDSKSSASLVKKRPGSEHFEFLHDEIASWNLFSEVGRIILYANEHSSFTHIHFDWEKQDDFVWLPITSKKFFVYNQHTKEKHFLKGRACTFNNSDYHGSDPSPFAQLSMRVDGIFRPEVTARLAELCPPPVVTG